MKDKQGIIPNNIKEFDITDSIDNINLEPTAEDIANEELSNSNDNIVDCVHNNQTTYLDTDYSTYINSIKEIPILTQQEELELAYKIKEGDIYAKEQLAKHNLKLVVSIALHYYNEYMTPMDLIQEGNIGLISAVEKFNPELGYRFSTYATWWIKQSITRAISNQGRIIRLPVHMIEKVNKITQAKKQIINQSQTDNPSEKEIAEYLNWPIEEVRKILINTNDTLSYDSPVSGEDNSMGSTLGDFIQDENANTAEEGEKYAITEFINDIMTSLNEREQKVLQLRMGFIDGKVYTLQEIGEMYHVSRERIRQIETKALKKLRSNKNKKIIKQILNK